MDQAPDNPTTNQIGQGLTEDQVRAAVEKSGYPLQAIVCQMLRAKPSGKVRFSVREEWSFVDRDSKELRNIDALAELRLHDRSPQPRVRPMLNLLVQCKQSSLPYVFFLAPRGPGWLMDSPSIAGLPTDRVRIATDDSPWPYNLTVIHALDLG